MGRNGRNVRTPGGASVQHDHISRPNPFRFREGARGQALVVFFAAAVITAAVFIAAIFVAAIFVAAIIDIAR